MYNYNCSHIRNLNNVKRATSIAKKDKRQILHEFLHVIYLFLPKINCKFSLFRNKILYSPIPTWMRTWNEYRLFSYEMIYYTFLNWLWLIDLIAHPWKGLYPSDVYTLSPSFLVVSLLLNNCNWESSILLMRSNNFFCGLLFFFL